jgi:peptidoglycan/LPS O-acetylase OafA/YrhL
MVLAGLISIYFADRVLESITGFTLNHFLTTTYLYYFGLGALLAVLLMNFPEQAKKLAGHLTATWIQFTLVLVGMLFVFNVITDTKYSETAIILLNGVFGLYLIFVAISGRLIFDVLGNKVTRFLGNISYPMYLIHPVLVWGFCFKRIIATNENLTNTDKAFTFPIV